MLQVFTNTNLRLMWGTKWFFMGFSVLSMVVAIGAMVIKGFNYGIDFAGGTAVQVKFREAPRVEELRTALEAAGLGDISIQAIGDADDNEVLIRVEQHAVKGGAAAGEGGEISREILEALRGPEERAAAQTGKLNLNMASEAELAEWLAARLGGGAGAAAGAAESGSGPAAIAAALVRYRTEHQGILTDETALAGIPGMTPEAARLLREEVFLGPFALRSVEFVGPTAGNELLRDTGLAILGSVLGILIYVWFRFHKYTWGVAAVVALVHDVTIAAGAVALTGKEFSLPVVAALLTILGYSINDTIVVYDRIRENLRLHREHEFEEIVNASVNQTLSRTILTQFTVFIAVTALYLYGGDKLNPLAFCLMVGVVFGTYSSIFVASALLVLAGRYLGAQSVRA
jgi:preprotein translocase subunit SecF